ncbi:ABC transporter permease [Wenxinia marina]|uniref:Wenxma_15, whole genome shotgun sequence n=1 Tax=Wenxinia marina DSM 24838 TaxID=1123501 RepID=A0A0D0Q0U7_9RHOB|nr:ABC transporter permease [Wenxinia marina]KIQ68169.1 ABC-type dipeptide/oligopeptide/nickel transport system, permease component [Wenxinia marina DSM 24838]GGL76458.1 peptide ABC transporter permease [Wenxinia marina]
MLTYILRRLLLLPVVLFALSLMIFSLQMLLTPTQRLAAYVSGPEALKGGAEQVADLIEKYGLNDPFLVQYGRWIGGVLQGNLGWSETARQPVADALISLFPATLELVLLAFTLSFLLSIALGTLAGVNLNRLPDHVIRLVTILGWSFPTYVFGLVMLLIFYGALDWFPPSRLSQWAMTEVRSAEFVRYTGLNTIDALLNGNLPVFWDALRHLILPVVTLTFVSIASLTRIMRTSMLETLRQDYVRTARAKGLPRRVVERRHARRNAMLPVVTMAGMELAAMMGGVVITETIFDYHGLGQFAADAAAALDFPAVLGFGLYFAVVLVVMNLLVDVIYPVLDPRVRLR